ncbi:MAG: pyruvate kinase [Roseiarcus sp.]
MTTISATNSDQLPPPSPAPVPAPTAQTSAREALEAILLVREDVRRESERLLKSWRDAIALSAYRPSAKNLARYLALRRHDLSDLQPTLSALGLSSLGRCEGHVMANLDAVAAALSRICGADGEPFPDADVWSEGERLLAAQRRALFGQENRATAIMVTLPTEAASDPALVETFVATGLDCARINCAHDDEQAWVAMVKHVRQAAKKFGRDCKILMDLPGPKCRVETLWPKKPERIHVGECFRLAVSPGQANVAAMPVVTVGFPEVVANLPLQAQVWIDDGKIRGRVVGVEGKDRIVEVVGARAKGEKLRLEKGVNFPGTPLDLPALSADDLAALPAIARDADMVGFSFVQRPQDIVDLDRAIAAARPGRSAMPLVLKIETREAVRNLPGLIVQAAGTRPTAVMIARGDLAVELGHIRMAEIQEEILWLCEAARIPVVWATQVLDDLVKDGLPSRAETTDAAMAQRAECVMLNKGPHVVEAIRFLSDIVGKMSRHQTKKYSLLGALHSWPLDALAIEPRPRAGATKANASPPSAAAPGA